MQHFDNFWSSSKNPPKEGSGKNSITGTDITAKDEAKADIEEANDDEIDDDIIESSKRDRDNTHLRTMELELAKNTTTILRAATKREGDATLHTIWSASWMIMRARPVNSGGSWEPSSKEILELQESVVTNDMLRLIHDGN